MPVHSPPTNATYQDKDNRVIVTWWNLGYLAVLEHGESEAAQPGSVLFKIVQILPHPESDSSLCAKFPAPLAESTDDIDEAIAFVSGFVNSEGEISYMLRNQKDYKIIADREELRNHPPYLRNIFIQLYLDASNIIREIAEEQALDKNKAFEEQDVDPDFTTPILNQADNFTQRIGEGSLSEEEYHKILNADYKKEKKKEDHLRHGIINILGINLINISLHVGTANGN